MTDTKPGVTGTMSVEVADTLEMMFMQTAGAMIAASGAELRCRPTLDKGSLSFAVELSVPNNSLLGMASNGPGGETISAGLQRLSDRVSEAGCEALVALIAAMAQHIQDVGGVVVTGGPKEDRTEDESAPVVAVE